MSVQRVSLREIVREEVPVYSDRPYCLGDFLRLLAFDGGFQLDFIYRVSHYYFKKRGHLSIFVRLLTSVGRMITSSYIDPRAEVGARCYIAYGLGIVIGSHSKIGNDCRIFSGASLASARPGKAAVKQPQIGNGVLIGAGAKLLGDIHIGDNCVIGANAVVTRSFGPDQVIAGVPAVPIRSQVGNDDNVANTLTPRSRN